MNIQIVIALDEKYWHKAKEYGLFDSILKHTSTSGNIFVKCLCLGFSIPDADKHFKHHRWSWAKCEINELATFIPNYPRKQKGRNFFICAEGGEFLDYFTFNPSDVIVHIDADVTMQRPFHEWELSLLGSLRYGEVAGTFHALPSYSLLDEAEKIRPEEPIENIKKHFPNHWDKPVFCTGVVVATAQTYRDVIYKHYIPKINTMAMLFDHHAIGQWLMNQVVYEQGNFVNLGHIFHHADWFVGSDKKDVIDNKLCYKESIVLFNHHKFNKNWNF